MKKILGFLLALTMVFTLVSCGGNNGTTDNEPTAQPNASTTPLADARVRQAIAYAIDMDALVDGLFEGYAVATNSMIPPSDPFRNNDLTWYKYDPEKAKQLLAEANWDPNYVLDVVYYYGDQQTVDLMTAIQSYLADVGMKMTFRKVEGDVAAQLWTAPDDPVNGPSAVDWDMCYGAVAALTDHDYYNRFSSTSSNNSHTPKDAELDALIKTTNSTNNFEEQKEAFLGIQRIINEKVYAIPLYHQQLFIYENTRLDRAGYPYGNDQYFYDWGIIDWKLDGSTTLNTIGAPAEAFPAPLLNPGLDMSNKLLFDRLILADNTLTPSKPMLAESYDMSDDGLTLTFNLRNDVKWHDGVQFSADDVVFTIETLIKSSLTNGVAQNAMLAIEGAQAYKDGTADSISGITVDGNKVTIKFQEVNPNELVVFSQWPILPEHLLGSVDPDKLQQDKFWQFPIGTGPFKLKEVNLNDYATFVRNDDYFMKGTGNIQTIQMTVGGETEGNIPLSAEAGKLDFAFGKSVPEAQAIEQLDNMTVTPVDIRYTRMLYINKFPHSD